MARRLDLVHPSGLQRPAFVGWSWTSFFFGGFPALFRSDVMGFLAWAGVAVVLALLTLGWGFIPMWFIWAAIYNRWHLTRLLEVGYRVSDGTAPPATFQRQPVGRAGSLAILGVLGLVGVLSFALGERRQPAPAPVPAVAVPSVIVSVPVAPERARVTVRQDANVRAEPNGQAAIVRRAPAGIVLEVFADSGNWRQVGQGQPWGFIHSSLLQ